MNTNIDTNAQEINRENENPVNETAPHLMKSRIALLDPISGEFTVFPITIFDDYDPIKCIRLLIQNGDMRMLARRFDGLIAFEWLPSHKAGRA